MKLSKCYGVIKKTVKKLTSFFYVFQSKLCDLILNSENIFVR